MPSETRTEVADLLDGARTRTDTVLARWATRLRNEVRGDEGEALAYALESPGKRVRPALVHAAWRACSGGGNEPGEKESAVASIGAAVEVVHTYSLVHDDLPCMDDDDQRRGRPTLHRRFGTEVATRAGYALVAVAAEVLAEGADQADLGPEGLSRMARVLFSASGLHGMVGGQWCDLEAERRHLALDPLRKVHAAKTGALIQASCLLGGILADAPTEWMTGLHAFGADIGLAFQVADDVLDATGTSAELGKTAGRDATLGKSTYVSLLGATGAAQEAGRLVAQAEAHLAPLGPATRPLALLGRYIAQRRS